MSNSVPSNESSGNPGTARDFLSRGRKEVVPLMEEHSLAQKLAAEFIGTALLVFVGAGSVPAMILLTSEAPRRSRGRRSAWVRARVRADRGGDGLHGRQGVGLSHQPGGDVRARRPRSGSPGAACPPTGARRLPAGSPAHWRSGPSFGSRVFDFGAGFGCRRLQPRRHQLGLRDVRRSAWATGILLFTILGIVDTRSPEGWAGLVIGYFVIVGIIITVGPITERVDQPGPRARAGSSRGSEWVFPQLDRAAVGLHPGRSRRSGARRVRLRLGREAPDRRSGRSRRPSRSRIGPTHSRPPPTPREDLK